jgi:hypothetical protein
VAKYVVYRRKPPFEESKVLPVIMGLVALAVVVYFMLQ